MSLPAQIQPEALQKAMESAAEMLVNRRGRRSEDDMAVIFTGNVHHAVPQELITSHELSPSDKVLWQVLRIELTDPSRPTAMPDREVLASKCNVSSPTVSASRKMLRITRWLTQSRAIRDRGQFIGSVVFLHGEPLSLETTLKIDPGYIEFLYSVVEHDKRKQHRIAAAAIINELREILDNTPPSEWQAITQRWDREDFASAWHEAPVDDSRLRQILGLEDDAATTVDHEPEPDPLPPGPSGSTPSAKASRDQSKNFAMVNFPSSSDQNHQSKNLSLAAAEAKSEASNQNCAEINQIGRKTTQSKIFAAVNRRKKFLAAAVWRSSSSSSSLELYKYTYTRTHVRAREPDSRSPSSSQTLDQLDLALIGSQPASAPTASHASQRPPVKPPEYRAPGRPRLVKAEEGAQTYDWLMTHAEIDDAIGQGEWGKGEFSDREALLKISPRFADSQIQLYAQSLFAGRADTFHLVAIKLSSLPVRQRELIALQLISRGVADCRGLTRSRLRNPLAYTAELMKQSIRGEFLPDEFALELLRHLNEGKDIEFPPSEIGAGMNPQ